MRTRGIRPDQDTARRDGVIPLAAWGSCRYSYRARVRESEGVQQGQTHYNFVVEMVVLDMVYMSIFFSRLRTL